MAAITIMLMVDKSRNRVAFAESDKDFVDILLSFLTLPIGTVIRLSGKQASLGRMDNLYQSIENHNIGHPMSDTFSYPKNASGFIRDKLPVNVDPEGTIRYYYYCQDGRCRYYLVSYYETARCMCGKEMRQRARVVDADDTGNVFVKWPARFVITDDLAISPVLDSFELLAELGIRDEILQGTDGSHGSYIYTGCQSAHAFIHLEHCSERHVFAERRQILNPHKAETTTFWYFST